MWRTTRRRDARSGRRRMRPVGSRDAPIPVIGPERAIRKLLLLVGIAAAVIVLRAQVGSWLTSAARDVGVLVGREVKHAVQPELNKLLHGHGSHARASRHHRG